MSLHLSMEVQGYFFPLKVIAFDIFIWCIHGLSIVYDPSHICKYIYMYILIIANQNRTKIAFELKPDSSSWSADNWILYYNPLISNNGNILSETLNYACKE